MNQNLIVPSDRVFIIGAGMVGATTAYALLLEEIASEVVLIDIAEDLAQAQTLDLEDAASFTRGVRVSYGSYQDLRDGDIVVITAGAAQKPGQTRTDLLQTNSKIMTNIFQQINVQGKKLYLVMVTNPVDVLTYQAVQELEQPAQRIFGTGTILDTARLRAAIASITDINPRNVHAYVLGEHGDTSFPALSAATAGGMKLDKLSSLSREKSHELEGLVRQRAYKIIEGKKATYYGIAAAIARICSAIIHDENKMYTLSVLLNGQYGEEDVCISVPVQLGELGYSFLGEIHLSEKELASFKKSAETIKSNAILAAA